MSKIRIRIWLGDGTASETEGPDWGNPSVYDIAREMGAIRCINPFSGEIYRIIDGDWVGVGYEKPKPKLRKRRRLKAPT